MAVPARLPGIAVRPMRARPIVDLPLPDSPTSATVSPGARSNETPLTASTIPARPEKRTARSRTSSSADWRIAVIPRLLARAVAFASQRVASRQSLVAAAFGPCSLRSPTRSFLASLHRRWRSLSQRVASRQSLVAAAFGPCSLRSPTRSFHRGSHEIEAQYREPDSRTGPKAEQGIDRQEIVSGAYHAAPVGCGRRNAQAEKTQAR